MYQPVVMYISQEKTTYLCTVTKFASFHTTQSLYDKTLQYMHTFEQLSLSE